MACAIVCIAGVESWEEQVVPLSVYQRELGEVRDVCSGVEVVFACDIMVFRVCISGWRALEGERYYLCEELWGQVDRVAHSALFLGVVGR